MSDLDLLLLERRVECLLAPWDRPGSPGVSIGVVRDGALVLHRYAGLASIELDHPIGPRTTFRIASVTKQFTCAAVLMLAAEGRLGLEDDIRKHIPEFPDLGARITVAQLMHNASGIRDMLEILRIGGTDLGQQCTRDDLIAGICRQRGLNFPPGSRFLYSNSNFLLLGLIVERLSGETLRSFLEHRIFAPLGMTATRLASSIDEIVPNLATGYLPEESGWVRARHGFPVSGEGGLVSSVEDLALWDRNFTTGRVGGTALAQALERQAPFANGTVNPYARGLEVAQHRGLRTVSHGGLWPGYKTEFLRVPERNLTIICIANNATASPYDLAHQVLDVLLDGQPGTQAAPARPQRSTLERLPGRYLDRDNLLTLDLSLEPDGTAKANMHGTTFTLVAAAGNRLKAWRGAFPFILRAAADGDSLEVETDANARAIFHRLGGEAKLPEDLPGRYVSGEIGAVWRIAAAADGKMTVDVEGPLHRVGGWEIAPIDGDVIRVYTPGIVTRVWLDVRAERDGAGRITGLRVHGGRARNLVFARDGHA